MPRIDKLEFIDCFSIMMTVDVRETVFNILADRCLPIRHLNLTKSYIGAMNLTELISFANKGLILDKLTLDPSVIEKAKVPQQPTGLKKLFTKA